MNKCMYCRNFDKKKIIKVCNYTVSQKCNQDEKRIHHLTLLVDAIY